MKKTILLLMLLLGSISYSSAQGNLQFNQVILQDFSATMTSYTVTVVGTIVVPAGKVWKIEYADLWYLNTIRNSESGNYSLYVNNTVLRRSRGGTGNYNQGGDQLPVWLPAGSYDIVISNEYSSTRNYVGSINAIEFNVIP